MFDPAILEPSIYRSSSCSSHLIYDDAKIIDAVQYSDIAHKLFQSIFLTTTSENFD